MKTKILLIAIIIIGAILRLNQITTLPALNADEAALGYNAYSLIQTGKDEHGQPWPLVFKSFGDYKPGVYIYLVIPFIKLLGLNVLAARLPGLILSILSIYFIYLIVKEITPDSHIRENDKHLPIINYYLPLLVAFLLAISPWHIHFSRGAWETQTSTAFILLGVYGFLKALKKPFWYLIFTISFILAIYTYHSMRLVAPLLGISLILIYHQQILNHLKIIRIGYIKWQIISVFIGFILIIPLFYSLFSQTGLSRAAGVSIFADSGPINRINEARGLHQNYNSLLVKILYNKPTAYTIKFLDNYLRHFSGNFLFLDGDDIQRNKVPEFGQLYLVSIPFVFLGLYWLLSNIKSKVNGQLSVVVLAWLLIAPIPSALTFQSPHALRSFSLVIPLTIITALGISRIISLLQSEKFNKILLPTFYLLISILFIWDFSRYLHQYYRLMVPTYPYSSQYGLSELVPYLESVKQQYDRIYVTDRYDQPYILFLFYSQYPPQQFQSQVVLTPRDQYGFSTVRNYDNYYFQSIDFQSLKEANSNSLIIGTVEEIPDSANIIKEIKLNPQYTIFRIAQT